jgi:hypothetical protein
MSQLTWREYRTRLAWLDLVDRNRPGKTEEYLMQVALRIVQFAGFGSSSDRMSLPLDSQKLRWTSSEVSPAYSPRELAERSAAQAKAAFVGAARGGKTQVKLVDGPRVPLPPSQASSEVDNDDRD